MSDLDICVAVNAGEVTLRVRGDVNAASAADLGAVLDAMVARGRRRLLIDLVDVARLGTTGADVIAAAAGRLGPSELVIVGPNAEVSPRLAAAGLSEYLRRERPSDGHLAAEQTVAVPGSPVTTLTPDPTPAAPAHDVAGGVRRLMAVASDDGVIDGALGLVVALATRTVGGADGVSVSLRRRGRLATVAASDETINDMDDHQYGTGEGPCLDASVEGRWFHVESLAAETRWPAFTPKAQALGINAILSSPLLVRDQPVGALNIYSRRAGAFAPEDQELASVFATEASTVLTAASFDTTEEEVAAGLAQALHSRQAIAQAQGVLMARHHVTPERAYAALRRVSARTSTPLARYARQVVSSTQRGDPGPGMQGAHDDR